MYNKYLNEEKYQENKNKVKKVSKILLILGIIILLLGIVFLAMGFLGFSNIFDIGQKSAEVGNIDDSQISKGMFESFGLISLGMITTSIGVSLLMGSGIAMFVAHSRDINAFNAQSSIPVAKEVVNEMAPSVGTVAKEVTKGIKEGLDDENKS